MDLERYKPETAWNKALGEKVMASQNDGGTNAVMFTFVPSTGTLPSKVLLEKDIHYMPKILRDHKGASGEKPGEKVSKKYSPEVLSKTCLKQSFAENLPKDSASNQPERTKHNDLFIAEFVVVMDSDDGEDTMSTGKNQSVAFQEKGYEFRRMWQSTAQPKAAEARANEDKIYDVAEEHQELSHDHRSSLPSVGMDTFRHQFTNLSYPSKIITERKGHFNLSNENQTEAMDTFQPPLLSPKSDSCNVSVTNKTQPINLETFQDPSQMQSQYTPLGSKRSNVLSQLPIQIVKYPLCRSPSPLNSSIYGSSSTICSMNDTSPVPRASVVSPVPSRLSFLTSVLKSKKSIYDRTLSPDPSQYGPGTHPASPHSFFHRTDTSSSPPRKTQSCFSLNYSKDSKIFNRKNEILPSSSESDIVYGAPSFHSEPLRSLSPESTQLRSFSSSFLSRKGVVSPLPEPSHQPYTALHSSRENIPPLNEKPPLNRPIYTPLKKYSVLGRSKRITLFPPPQPFHQPPSGASSQKMNVAQNRKINLPVRSGMRSYDSTENLDQSRSRSISPMDISESHRDSPSTPSAMHSSHANLDLEPNSPLLSPSCIQEFQRLDVLSRHRSPTCFSPTNLLTSPRSNVSSSCELRSISSLSQRDEQENQQSYKIKSSYKAFAAIPTNTLLKDQKAIDKPQINTANGASAEKIDSRSEMCSPAMLRQQTEEICAAIDEVLHDDPLPMYCKSVSKPVIKKTEPTSANIQKSPRKSAGRETRYASIQHLTNTGMKNLARTRPGVIHPVSLKIRTMEPMDGRYSLPDQHLHFASV